MFSDQHVRDAVRMELAREPRLPQPDEIAVEVLDGYVTLRGTVGSFAQRRAAVAATRRAEGIIGIGDELQVRPLNDDRRQDAEIRGHALERLIWDASLPGRSLDAHVAGGWVTLKGTVDFQFQSDLAFDDVAGLRGVVGVTNDIEVNEVVRT